MLFGLVVCVKYLGMIRRSNEASTFSNQGLLRTNTTTFLGLQHSHDSESKG